MENLIKLTPKRIKPAVYLWDMIVAMEALIHSRVGRLVPVCLK